MFQLLRLIICLAFISLGLPDSMLGFAWPTMYQEFSVPNQRFPVSGLHPGDSAVHDSDVRKGASEGQIEPTGKTGVSQTREVIK